MECMYVLAQVHVIIHVDDAFTLNYHPTVPMGPEYEEQVGNAKCTRPFLPLVKGLAPRLQWQHSCSARTLLPDCWQVWQRTDPVSRFAQGSVASTCSAGLSKCMALHTSRSTMHMRVHASVANSMAWGIKATLCACGPTVLTNPEPYSADFLSACAMRS